MKGSGKLYVDYARPIPLNP